MNSHQAFPGFPLAVFTSAWHNRRLILQLTKREVLTRYRGSVLGVAWSFFNPLFMLVVYTFVFSVVFKARWNVGGSESTAEFAIVLFIGLIIYGLFAECLNRAPELVTSNVNYVKKVVFPLEILPWVLLGSAAFHSAISLLVLLLAQIFIQQTIPWTFVFLPFVFLPLFLVVLGLVWFLSGLGVYLRDVRQITAVVTTAMLFLSPVFYPIDNLPQKYHVFLYLNPITPIIEESRKVLFYGHPPDWGTLMLMLGVGLVLSAAGFWWFQKVRKGFADVL